MYLFILISIVFTLCQPTSPPELHAWASTPICPVSAPTDNSSANTREPCILYVYCLKQWLCRCDVQIFVDLVRTLRNTVFTVKTHVPHSTTHISVLPQQRASMPWWCEEGACRGTVWSQRNGGCAERLYIVDCFHNCILSYYDLIY